MNGLIVLAVAVAVLGCCLVFAVEDDLPHGNTATAAPVVPKSPEAVVLDLRPRLRLVDAKDEPAPEHASARPRMREAGGHLRTTTLRPRGSAAAKRASR